MSGFNQAFKSEVARLARKEVRGIVGKTQKASALHRREIAKLKREVGALQRQLAKLEKRRGGSPAPAPKGDTDETIRFSPKWLKAHRKKIGFSAREYALLVGVSQLTIYNWEAGKSKPQAAKLAALSRVRGIGKREALKLLADAES